MEPGALLDEGGQRHSEQEVTLLPPVAPRSVIELALNVAKHAAELEMKTPEEPALFIAPASWFEQSSIILDFDGQLVSLQSAQLQDRPQTATLMVTYGNAQEVVARRGRDCRRKSRRA